MVPDQGQRDAESDGPGPPADDVQPGDGVEPPPGYSLGDIRKASPAQPSVEPPPGYSADDIRTVEPGSLREKILARKMGLPQDVGTTTGPGDTLFGALGTGARTIGGVASGVSDFLENAPDPEAMRFVPPPTVAARPTGAPEPGLIGPTGPSPTGPGGPEEPRFARHMRGEDDYFAEGAARALSGPPSIEDVTLPGGAVGQRLARPSVGQAVSGAVGRAIGGLADYATSAAGAPMTAAFETEIVPEVATRLINGYFAKEIAGSFPGLWQQFKDNYANYKKTGDVAPLAGSLTSLAANGVILTGTALGTIRKPEGTKGVGVEDLGASDAEQAALNAGLKQPLDITAADLQKPTNVEPPPGYTKADIRRVVVAPHEAAREAPGQAAFPEPEPPAPTRADLELEEPDARQALSLDEVPRETPEEVQPEQPEGPTPEREPEHGEPAEPEERIPLEDDEKPPEPKIPERREQPRYRPTAPEPLRRRQLGTGFIDLTPEERAALGQPWARGEPFGEGIPGEEKPEPEGDLAATVERREGEPRTYPVGDAGLPGDMALLADRVHNPTSVEARVYPENLADIAEEHGPEAADQARKIVAGGLKAVAQAAGGEAFETRDGGFSVRAPDEDVLRATLEKMRGVLEKREWKIPLRDGTEARVKVEADYGLGRTEAEARGALESRQAERRKAASDAALGIRPGVPEGLERPQGAHEEGARGPELGDQLGAEREPSGVPGGEPAEGVGRRLTRADWDAGKGAWLKRLKARREEIADELQASGHLVDASDVDGILEREKMEARHGKEFDRNYRARDMTKVAAMKRLNRSRNATQLESEPYGVEEPRKPFGGEGRSSSREEAQKSLFDQIEASDPASGAGVLPSGIRSEKAPRGGGVSFEGPGRTLYSRVKEAFERSKPIDFTGQTVKSTHDLATVAQVARSPHTETFRTFYVDKAGNIVGHEAVTSDLPAVTAFYDLRQHPASYLGFLQNIRDRMKELGAEGYYILHNHPSGNPSASPADLKMTAGVAGRVHGFKGHVIIDHDSYGIVVPKDGIDLNSYEAHNPENWEAHRLELTTGSNLAEAHSLLTQQEPVNGTGALARVGREIANEGAPALIYTDSQARVRGVEELPKGFLADRKAAEAHIERRVRDFGAGRAFAYQRGSGDDLAAFSRDAQPLVRSGHLTDYVVDRGGGEIADPAITASGLEMRPELASGKTLGMNSDDYPSYRVQEAQPEFSPRKPPLEPSDDEEIPKYAGNINLDRKDVSEQVQRTIMSAAARIGEKPETVSLDALKKKLDGSPYSVEDAKKFAATSLQQRGGWYATRQVADGMADRHNEIRKAYLADPTLENYQKLDRVTTALLEATKAEMTAAHEAGLALRTGGMMSEGKIGQLQLRRRINELVEKIKERGRFTPEVAQALAETDFTDPEATGRLAVALSPKAAGWADKLFEYRVGVGLLTPVTPVKKLLGDVVGVGSRLAESGLAPIVDIARAKLEGTARERFSGAAMADLRGLMAGASDGAQTLVHDLKNETFGHAGVLGDRNIRGPAIEGTKGKVLRANLRLINAANNAAMTVSYRGALYRDALNLAGKEGLTGDARASRVQELVSKPTLEAQEAAWKDAAYRAYQAKLGQTGEAMLRARGPMRWIVPFARIPTNLLKFAGERSPLNLLMRIPYKILKGELRGGELTDQLTRSIIGSTIASGVAAYAMSGHISGGGPTDPKELANLRNTGWQPYSVYIGGRWFPYKSLDPMATIVGPVADFVEMSKEAPREKQGELASRLVATISRNIASKTFLQGLEDFFSMMSVKDAPGSAEQFLASFASGFEPSVVRRATVGADKVERNPQTMAQRLEQYVPGMRGDVPERRDVRGRAVPTPGSDLPEPLGTGVRNLSPVVPSVAAAADPIDRELQRSAAFLPQLPKKLEWRGLDLPLDSHQQDRYQQIVGDIINRRIEALGGNMERFSQAGDEAKRKAVQRLVSQAHEIGKRQMIRELSQGDDLKDLVAQAKKEKERLGQPSTYFTGEDVAARE